MKTNDPGVRPLAVYIHIPFCVRKCAYCDFLSFPGTEAVQKDYVGKLLWEMRSEAERYWTYEVQTVFIGGGTPTSLKAEYIAQIMDVLQQEYHLGRDAECTIECNPGTADREKLVCYRKAGINRISIGCQSVYERELQLLGRIHSPEQFREIFTAARDAGFDNINVDLMSGLPGQSPADWEESLRTIAEMEPEHISAYSLIIEENTPFFEEYGSQAAWREKGLDTQQIRKRLAGLRGRAGQPVQLLLPSEDEEREMYHRTTELLAACGYHQYELSNHAKTGRECRHNLVYWKRGDYAGFGLGAASCISDCRRKNTGDMQAYRMAARPEALWCETEALTEEEQRAEAMFLGLRLTEGVDTGVFSARYGLAPEQYYGEWIGRMKKEGLLEECAGHLRLTLRGRDLANVVMAGFV